MSLPPLEAHSLPDRMEGVMPETALGFALQRLAVTERLGQPGQNPSLRVQTLGFRDWQENRVGIAITPWAMQLILFRQQDEDWLALEAAKFQSFDFPGGHYGFQAQAFPECGPYLSCTLFGAMEIFAGQDEARTTAEAVLAGLFADPAAGSRATSLESAAKGPDLATGTPHPLAGSALTEADRDLTMPEKEAASSEMPAALSRRQFLFGRRR